MLLYLFITAESAGPGLLPDVSPFILHLDGCRLMLWSLQMSGVADSHKVCYLATPNYVRNQQIKASLSANQECKRPRHCLEDDTFITHIV